MQTSRLTFDKISPTQQSAIDKLVGESFFASQNFLKLWEHMDGRPVYWIVEDDDNVVAVLPAVEFGIAKLKRLQALPDGCYSSVFVKGSKSIKEYKSELLKVIQSYGYQKIDITDFYDSISNAVGYEKLECQTTLIDVSSSDWQPPDKKLQSEIRKAERENVRVVKFNASKHFSKFIKLMKETEARHDRKPKYSDSFFMALAELSEDDKRIIWNWCEHEGKAVSSHINFIEQNQILNWQVYFDKQFSSLKANQKMLSDLAQTARDNNIQYLNLGASPIETTTLVEYKNKWGGRTKEYICYKKRSLLGKLF